MDEVQKVLQTAQFALAGMFYYLGGLVGFLHERGIYQEDNVPSIYIGGNGSRIFSWICNGAFDEQYVEDGGYLSVLRDMFVSASNLNLDLGFSMMLSHTPKIEVARGMVEGLPPAANFFNPTQIAQSLFGEENGANVLIANSVFAGDSFKKNNEKHSKTEFISAYDVSEGI